MNDTVAVVVIVLGFLGFIVSVLLLRWILGIYVIIKELKQIKDNFKQNSEYQLHEMRKTNQQLQEFLNRLQ